MQIITGGTRPYKYKFDNSTLGLDSIFTQLIPGTYQILVNDAQGCKDSTQTVIELSQDIFADFDFYSSPYIESAGVYRTLLLRATVQQTIFGTLVIIIMKILKILVTFIPIMGTNKLNL